MIRQSTLLLSGFSSNLSPALSRPLAQACIPAVGVVPSVLGARGIHSNAELNLLPRRVRERAWSKKPIQSTSVWIPEEKLYFKAERGRKGRGKGKGKNTKVSYSFNVLEADWLAEEERARLLHQQKNMINENGELVVESSVGNHTQVSRKDALEKLHQVVNKASMQPKERESLQDLQAKRDQALKFQKKHRSEIKASRKVKRNQAFVERDVGKWSRSRRGEYVPDSQIQVRR